MKKILSYKVKHKKRAIFIVIAFLLIAFFNPTTQNYLYQRREQKERRQYTKEFDSVISPVPSGFQLKDEEFIYVDGLNRIETRSNLIRTYRVNSTREKVFQALKSLFEKKNMKIEDAVYNNSDTDFKDSYNDFWVANDLNGYQFNGQLTPTTEEFPLDYPLLGSTPVTKVTIILDD